MGISGKNREPTIPGVLSDSSLLQGALDLFLLKPHDNLFPDEDRGGGPPAGLLGKFLQVFRVSDNVFFEERNAFLREKLPRGLAGVSGGIVVDDNLRGHARTSSGRIPPAFSGGLGIHPFHQTIPFLVHVPLDLLPIPFTEKGEAPLGF